MSVVRGLAAGGVAAVTGLTRTSDEVDAKKGKKAICQCTGNTVGSCFDKKAKKKGGKKIFKANPCSYEGKCRGFNICSPEPTGRNTITFISAPISPGDGVLPALLNSLCKTSGGQPDCLIDTQRCVAVDALGINVCLDECGAGNSCPAGSTCVLGLCLPLVTNVVCDAGKDCQTQFCVDVLCRRRGVFQ